MIHSQSMFIINEQLGFMDNGDASRTAVCAGVGVEFLLVGAAARDLVLHYG